jgi:alkylhydroperoxidase/carboxymuconolactone decarboxylase family protein YurZ
MARLDAAQQRAKDNYIKNRGFWHESLDPFLEMGADLFETYLRYSAVPWRRGHLEPKLKEFVYITLDAVATHLYEPGLRLHIQNALRYGATPDEMRAVLALIGIIGVHSFTSALPVLVEEAGLQESPGLGKLSPMQEEQLEAARSRMGYWHPALRHLLVLDPECFEALADLNAVAARNPLLAPKAKAFILLAADVSTTRIYEPAVRIHIRNALDAGASVEEIIEVLQLTSVVGLHSCTFGGRVLAEELMKAGVAD